ncbi:exosortase-associated protein EpsI, V-type [Phenylobacterium koreense]|uniref:EpsI family protein n=1 Tax=Phenylobacterium koreense TaxID=266125 RepID=A0ABV2EM27_9CAUL
MIGLACLGAAGAAYELEPRRRQVLLESGKMADVVPLQFDDWSAENSDGLVQAPEEGTLAASLYSELVGRIYHQAGTGTAIMMLIAYGGTQSDMLQLHRPESCYPAVGFTLVSSEPSTLRIGRGAAIPIRRVVASMADRQENIIYWARLGEYMPNSAGEQREARLRASMQGYVPDGALVRFSVVGADRDAAFAAMDRFIPELLAAIAPDQRRALVGTTLAHQMSA